MNRFQFREVTYRPSKLRRWINAGAFWTCAAIMFAMSLDSLMTRPQTSASIQASLFAAAVTVIFSVATVRVIRVRLELRNGELSIYGVLRNHHVDAGSISEVRVGRLRRQPCLYIVSDDHSCVLLPFVFTEGRSVSIEEVRNRILSTISEAKVESSSQRAPKVSDTKDAD